MTPVERAVFALAAALAGLAAGLAWPAVERRLAAAHPWADAAALRSGRHLVGLDLTREERRQRALRDSPYGQDAFGKGKEICS